MKKRTRPVRTEFRVTEQERQLIRKKKDQLGTKNMEPIFARWRSAATSLRWITPSRKKLAAAVSNAAANINHICRRINWNGRFYADDVAELKARQAEIWNTAA